MEHELVLRLEEIKELLIAIAVKLEVIEVNEKPKENIDHNNNNVEDRSR